MSSYTIAAFFSVGYPGGYVPFRSGMVATKKTIITELEDEIGKMHWMMMGGS